MTQEVYVGLCVSGPYDGRQVAHDTKSFVVLIRDSLRSADLLAKAPLDSADLSVAEVRYTLQSIAVDDSAIYLWVPDGLSAKEAVILILSRYSSYLEQCRVENNT